MGLPTQVVEALAQIQVTSPTDIQQQTIPLALEGHDILASSQTGSGKTLSYLLPTITQIINNGGKALVLTPTRELTLQVCETLNKMAKKVAVSGVAIIGGEPFFKQTTKLKTKPNFIVGTPGRMIDHLTRKTIKLDDIRYLILDEMDSMLDMGMKKQLDQILNYMPKERQVLMFSATVPGHILEISRKYLNNPKRVTIGSATKPAPEVDQKFIKMPQGDKYKELGSQLLEKEGTAIVFVTTKRGADKLTGRLRDDGHRADVIHGGLNQHKRSKVIAGFRAEKTRILVATDIAARGLDINHIKLVFNYDLPMSAEDYLHRIGRTGRAGAKGHAISFVSPEDSSKMRAIERLINKGESTPRESFKKKSSRGDRRNDAKPSFGGKRGERRSDSKWCFEENEGKQRKRYGKKSTGSTTGGGKRFGEKSDAGQGFFPKKGNRPKNKNRAA